MEEFNDNALILNPINTKLGSTRPVEFKDSMFADTHKKLSRTQPIDQIKPDIRHQMESDEPEEWKNTGKDNLQGLDRRKPSEEPSSKDYIGSTNNLHNKFSRMADVDVALPKSKPKAKFDPGVLRL